MEVTASMVKEATVQKALVERLEHEFPGIYLRKIHQSRYSHAGIPDLLFCLNGHFGGIEVKTTTGKVSKLQDRELKLIIKAGGIALLCIGHGGIDEVIRVLRDKALRTSVEDY